MIYHYSNDRLINVKILLKGEKIDEIDIAYSNDDNGNWIKKTIQKDGKNVTIITRAIIY